MYFNREDYGSRIRSLRKNRGLTQVLLHRRAKREISKSHDSPFDQKIFCGQCGTSFRKKVSHEKMFWSCRKHSQNTQSCPVTQVLDSEIRETFVRFYFKLKQNNEDILSQMLLSLQAIRNRRMLWSLDVIELMPIVWIWSVIFRSLINLWKQRSIDAMQYLDMEAWHKHRHRRKYTNTAKV